jgi:hypothetical protein
MRHSVKVALKIYAAYFIHRYIELCVADDKIPNGPNQNEEF